MVARLCVSMERLAGKREEGLAECLVLGEE